ncbi:MAG: GerMN domain-containing protein [Clostridiales bacterium]|nr:GerMN domain-containing protein [Clostridiales bacterium]
MISSRRLKTALATAALSVLMAMSVTGCREAESEPPAPVPGPATESPASQVPEPAAKSTSVLVYLVDGEKLTVARREISATPGVAAAAMDELLTGVAERESELGFATEIPEGTVLLGLQIEEGVATVDLSGEFQSGGGSTSMLLRVAQVVYTLTQFDTVDTVSFMIDGVPAEAIGGEGVMVDPPVGREDFTDNVLPLIFVESPAPWDAVEPPLRVTGVSNTFEATLLLELVDSGGRIIFEGMATATAGSGTWGTFDVVIDYEAELEGSGSLIVFEESAEDGSRINLKEIPIDLKR